MSETQQDLLRKALAAGIVIIEEKIKDNFDRVDNTLDHLEEDAGLKIACNINLVPSRDNSKIKVTSDIGFTESKVKDSGAIIVDHKPLFDDDKQ